MELLEIQTARLQGSGLSLIFSIAFMEVAINYSGLKILTSFLQKFFS